jgi:hypothetical protein
MTKIYKPRTKYQFMALHDDTPFVHLEEAPEPFKIVSCIYYQKRMPLTQVVNVIDQEKDNKIRQECLDLLHRALDYWLDHRTPQHDQGIQHMAAALQVGLAGRVDWGEWTTSEIVEYDWGGNEVKVVIEFSN